MSTFDIRVGQTNKFSVVWVFGRKSVKWLRLLAQVVVANQRSQSCWQGEKMFEIINFERRILLKNKLNVRSLDSIHWKAGGF